MRRDVTIPECAMTVLMIVQAAHRRDSHFLIRDIAHEATSQMPISRATAYRLARMAIDLLAIPYDCDEVRMARTKERRVDTRITTLSQRRAA